MSTQTFLCLVNVWKDTDLWNKIFCASKDYSERKRSLHEFGGFVLAIFFWSC